jgi:hypothetical protein
VKGKGRTEREWRWRDTGSAMGRGKRVTVRIILKGGFGRVEVGDLLEGMRLFNKWKRKSSLRDKRLDLRVRSTFALSFGRRLALASCWMFKLVEGRNHDEVGV